MPENNAILTCYKAQFMVTYGQHEGRKTPEKTREKEQKMEIKIKDQAALVYTPYNADFVKKIKAIGGARWDGESKAWKVPANTVAEVRAIMMDVYGETDEPVECEKVNVRLTFESSIHGWHAPVTILGKTIASAWGRDSGARVGDDVSFVEGNPTSGGSVKNWTTVIPEGSICVLHDVPKAMVKDENVPDGVRYEIEDRSAEVQRNALIQERERLLRRIAEIDAQLAQ